MQKIILRIAVLGMLCTTMAQAQELYMPRNIKKAYANGTRSLDGKPGKNYWQNKGKYDMTITVTPENKMVKGTESILYTNSSPDTLKQLAIRFVNNIHKPESPRGHSTGKDFLTTGLSISSFIINGETYKINAEGWGTAEFVRLKTPLKPGETAKMKIDWAYPLSKESGREGQLDSTGTTYFVAYAFPRVSVYDDYNGWDMIPHMDRAEFYNDFNDYQLNVRAPKNYVVWATGDLKNPDEVLQPKFAERLKKSYTSDEVISMANATEMARGEVTKQNAFNTWKFTADNITDVTFALSNRYVWDAGSVLVDPATKRRASVQSAYDEKAKDFSHGVDWSKQALSWFSQNWPGVPYPFSKMTVVQGFADMEYPMMVNDSSTPDMEFSQFVMNHEIAHTYFPFYMGINETRYAYMDEGWATTLEYLIACDQLGKEKAAENYKTFRVKRWIASNNSEEAMPVITQTILSTGNNSYVKPSLSYLGLKDMMGDDAFKKVLRGYMDRWNGKHPTPWDFFNSINDLSGQDLNWYWNNWFFSNNYIDLAISKVAIKGSDYVVTLNNVGGFAVPFDVKVIMADGSNQVFHQTPAIWKANQQTVSIPLKGLKNVTSIVIDGGIYMDANPKDNSWKK